MHIAFLTPEYPHERTGRYGGIGTSIKNAAEGLVVLGEKVSVFVVSQQENAVLQDNGITIHLIKQRKYKWFSWFFYKKYVQNYINNQVKLENIDVVEAPDWSGISAFMNFDCPLVVRFNGSDAYFCELEGRSQKRKNFWLEKIALRGADRFISVSEFTSDRTREIFKLKKKIEIIPNSIASDKFLPRPEMGLENRLLYFGTIIRKKGVLDLAEIFNKIIEKSPQSSLFFAGSDVKDLKTGKSTQKLVEQLLSPQAREHVHFLGILDYENVQNEIAKATVIVLPSHAEALPMTWLEAMAMEKALVTSNIGWAQEVMINGKTGFTVDPKSHQEYAEKTLQLLDDKNLRNAVGHEARVHVVNHFSAAKIAERNQQFYKQLCK
ncbi:glycosyltransferase family 4 protein [Flavimarina sp. Hel_I_48]|uniref:glycosyltransferase family 4 protein n=1 Tax=Flavimarina sp. Hel_I_48 TaxID=1392488 RepID=UPI0004DF8929|nr:glycosyltransferase family 4 protein [Flavimarina sp. Hel_I_48]